MKEIFNIIIPVLIQVESGGNVNAIGDGGKAVGCLQIHRIMVDDVNRIAEMQGWWDVHNFYNYDEFTLDDRYSKDKSIQMCEYYLEYYYQKYVKWWNEQCSKPLYHPMPFDVCEVLARLWNGGYAGLKRNPRATDNYWEKVKKELAQKRMGEI